MPRCVREASRLELLRRCKTVQRGRLVQTFCRPDPFGGLMAARPNRGHMAVGTLWQRPLALWLESARLSPVESWTPESRCGGSEPQSLRHARTPPPLSGVGDRFGPWRWISWIHARRPVLPVPASAACAWDYSVIPPAACLCPASLAIEGSPGRPMPAGCTCAARSMRVPVVRTLPESVGTIP